MRQTWLLIVLAVAAVLVAVPAVGLPAVDGSSAANAQAAENGSEVAPGERMSGVVGVGEAEISADHQQRAFGRQIAQAQSGDARANAVAERLTDVEQRLTELEQRRATLEQQHEAGEISDGRYRAEIARIVAQTETLRSLGNQTGQVAQGIPTDLLEQRNVSAERIQRISARASNLTGPEVAEIARGIAGNSVGKVPGGPPADIPMGPPDDDRPRGPPGGDDRHGGPSAGDRPGGPSDDPTDGNVDERPDSDNVTEEPPTDGNVTSVTPDTDADADGTSVDDTADDQQSDTDGTDQTAEDEQTANRE
jgi:hypothetical protein